MYRDKQYRVRDLRESIEDISMAATVAGDQVEKVFVADGDALKMPLDHWLPILRAAKEAFPNLRQVSCYAMASNILEKSDDELRSLRENGLELLYIGPESGDDVTLKRIAKGSTFEDHVRAAERARRCGLRISVIALLGAGGVERSAEHARETARLVTEMNPEYFAALTLTVVEGTPLARLQAKGRFELPDKRTLLGELRTMVAEARPTDAVFRTNHASNYLPLAGRLPRDRAPIVSMIDDALTGNIGLRPEWSRGL
jgi:radical SAM superfamily enzyme YgiQ (UPF0313 family)